MHLLPLPGGEQPNIAGRRRNKHCGNLEMSDVVSGLVDCGAACNVVASRPNEPPCIAAVAGAGVPAEWYWDTHCQTNTVDALAAKALQYNRVWRLTLLAWGCGLPLPTTCVSTLRPFR